LPSGEQNKIFKENAQYHGGKEFTGIANNKAISIVYNDIVDNSELNKIGGFLEKISKGWQKVLNNNSGDF